MALVLPFTPYAGRIKKALSDLVDKARETKFVTKVVTKSVPVIQEKIVEVPAPPPPLPSAFVPRKEVDITTLYNGISIQTKLDAQEGTYASIERKDQNSYTVEFQLKIHIPKANNTIAELGRVNPELPKMLPGLDAMLQSGKISGFYHKLYEKKTALVQQNLTRLNKLLDKHNFFDCETILELTHPQTSRKALLIQSEMDVVADGSDGDRMPTMSSDIYSSDYYQPFTSYEWAKRTNTANPLTAKYQARYDSVSKEYKQKGLSKERNAELKDELQELDSRIRALKGRSSLIAEKDPFIVISLLFKDYPRVLPHAPAMGDYAAVIHGKQILPAICGDYRPAMKMGEASLMIAKRHCGKAIWPAESRPLAREGERLSRRMRRPRRWLCPSQMGESLPTASTRGHDSACAGRDATGCERRHHHDRSCRCRATGQAGQCSQATDARCVHADSTAVHHSCEQGSAVASFTPPSSAAVLRSPA